MPLTCPYCYHGQEPHELLFMCDGQGSPGVRGCRPDIDDSRRDLTGYNSPTMPVYQAARIERGAGLCPEDGSWSAKRACQQCHTPLPHALLEGPCPLIGMVGDTSSGKTVFLTVLKKQLTGPVAERFDADVHLEGDQQAGSNSVNEWLDRHEHSLFQDKILPSPTPPSPLGRRVPLVLQWRHKQQRPLRRPTYPRTILSFCDVAGEDPSLMDRQRYLRASDGLIVMIDPYQIPGVRGGVPLPPKASDLRPIVDTVLSPLEAAIPAQGRAAVIATPVAVVVTKLDVIEPMLGSDHVLCREEPRRLRGYDEHFGSGMHEHVRTFLNQHGAADVDRFFRNNFLTYRYFAVSALGALPDYASAKVAHSGVRPRNVVEPLLWLMSLKGIIKEAPRG